ncbi:DUF1002 domain-containing protein [Clostridium tarantellae]|uniref:DUF1002 domain-containing protein n=1 Tax=Clostridium tarantellae TaxID=39493 RepID=A0A6I1MST6_9CLOT|nr:DUF1002 domain-containing protein [Clostridium tarantellae]MPQ45212.1 DUF1002 domain-containing protein [Clostridium tarantellae]
MLKRKNLLALAMAGLLILEANTMVLAKNNDVVYKEAISLGANLTAAQKLQMLNDFGVTQKDVNDGKVSVIEITNEDIREQLGMDKSKPIPKDSVSISSSCVQVEPKGTGISVKTNHLTEVTGDMLSNALITCGITDAKVEANAPYDVTGTAALAGILKGFESSTGKELPLENREVARNEINTTKNLANSVGADKASAIVSEAKKEVVKEKPENKEAIQQIVNETVNNYNVTLKPQEEQQLVNLMEQVRKLNLNYKDIKESLNKLSNNMKDQLIKAGVTIKESGFFEKIWKEIKGFIHWLDLKFNGEEYEDGSDTADTADVTPVDTGEVENQSMSYSSENNKENSTLPLKNSK